MNPSHRKKLSLLIAMLGAIPASAWADTELSEVVVQAPHNNNSGGYNPATSTTATKIQAPLRDIPQTVNVVSKDVLHDQNAMSIQDALQNVAGIGFSVGDGQRDQVMIRGFSAINDQFVDGIRDDALYFRDLSNIERVEVLKGPSSVLYGRGSSGGLVNRITKKPRANPIQEVGTTFGSSGQLRGEFDLGSANEANTLLFRLTGAAEDSENFRNKYFLERQAIAPSLTWKLQERTTLTVQADYLKDKRLSDQGLPSYHGAPVNVATDTYYGPANARDRAYVESEVSSTTTSLDHSFAPNLKLHSSLRTYDYSLDRNYTPVGSIKDGATPTITLSQARRKRDENGYYWQNELNHDLEIGSMRHQLLYGIEIGQQHKSEWLASRNSALTYDLFNPVLVDLAAIPDSTVPSTNARTKIDIAGLYLQDLASLAPQWKLLAGIRYDHLRQSRDDLTSKNMDLKRTDNTFSPRLGLVYQPSSQLSLYGSYSRSFQPIAESYTLKANSDDLKPTRTVNLEIGSKYDLGADASINLALFQMSQTNIQVADPNNTSYSLAVGEQRTRGVELSFNGEIAPRWELLSAYSYMLGRITKSTEKTSTGAPYQGNIAALTPRHSFNVWLKHKIGNGYYAAAGARSESSRYASSDNLVSLAGYTVFNLGAGYEAKNYDVTVTLKNLFDRKYFVAAHSGANDYNMPGDPRTLLVGARYRF